MFGVFNRSSIHIFLIVIVGLLSYSNTLDAPFQWDEPLYIEENAIIKNLDYFVEPSKAEGLESYIAFQNRHIGYLTFALNYKVNGLDVTGYHIVNISIHIINSLLVCLLVILTFKTPFLSESPLLARSKLIAFFAGLVFVSHPLQTEAVTYIFQRLASLVAMFYLLSLVLYIKFRLKGRATAAAFAYYLFSFLFAVLAMKTKENAFTLPLMIAIYELSFFDGPKWKRLLRLVPILSTLLIIPLSLTGIDKPPGEIINSIGPASRGYEGISRTDYLFTEFRVIVTYIRLLFLPVNQNVDYDYPVSHSFFDKEVLLSFLFLLCIFCLGVYLFYRSRKAHRALRLVAFGIFWFFTALSVESGAVPLPMAINEYRVYLPSAGAWIGIITAVFLMIERHGNRKAQIIMISALVLVSLSFSYAAYRRNDVWGSQMSLWQDVVEKSPHKARGYLNLGYSYLGSGMNDKAIECLEKALRLDPYGSDIHNNLGNAYKNKGLPDRAIEHYNIAIRSNPGDADPYNNLGAIYGDIGRIDRSIEYFLIAVKLRPDFSDAHFNLGFAYFKKGLFAEARGELEKALRINPDSDKARRLLSLIPIQDDARSR